jgi:haloalkane dehalogenase
VGLSRLPRVAVRVPPVKPLAALRPVVTDAPAEETDPAARPAAVPDGRVLDTDWLDREAYPFDSHFFEHEAGRVHYVDEGAGDPVLLLHGNPTWSFLYRHVVAGLSDDYRCVAPDYLGFGLSDKPRDWPYTPAAHAGVVEALVDHLDLTDLTVVGQDWGGPLGLDYATRHPETVRALVFANTWGWPLDDDPTARRFSKLFANPLGRLAVTRCNAFVRAVMPLAYADRSRLTPSIHEHYRRPLATPGDRLGSWVFPRELLGSRDWLADVWGRRDRVADTPALLAWGLEDPAFGPELLARWRRLFPDAPVVEFADCGHYVQEERGPELAAAIREFLDGLAD